MYRRLRKYVLMANLGLQHAVTYRARSLVWLLVDVFVIFVYPFVWLGAYGEADTIAGINKSQIVTYFIGVAFVNAAVTSHFEQRMRVEIKNGEFSNFMIKPINYFGYAALREMGWKSGHIAYLVPLFLAAIVVFREYLFMPADAMTLAFTAGAMLGSAILFVVLNFFIGLLGLFFVEAEAAAEFFWIAVATFSGVVAPMRFFPAWFQHIAQFLPFKYLVDFPVSIYVGTINQHDMMNGFLMIVLWIVVVWAGSRLLFRKGIRLFEGVGM